MRLAVLSAGAMFIASFASPTHPGLANAQQNKTLIQSQWVQSMTTTNATNMNIVLVHGTWADGSSWSKVIPILKNAGHHVVAVQLPEHSLADDVATVKRAIELVDGPTFLVGHSYGGMVITNAAYNNPNVKGLVYVAAFPPDQGQSLGNFVDVMKTDLKSNIGIAEMSLDQAVKILDKQLANDYLLFTKALHSAPQLLYFTPSRRPL